MKFLKTLFAVLLTSVSLVACDGGGLIDDSPAASGCTNGEALLAVYYKIQLGDTFEHVTNLVGCPPERYAVNERVDRAFWLAGRPVAGLTVSLDRNDIVLAKTYGTTFYQPDNTHQGGVNLREGPDDE